MVNTVDEGVMVKGAMVAAAHQMAHRAQIQRIYMFFGVVPGWEAE